MTNCVERQRQQLQVQSFMALATCAYCVLDAAGTFADSRVLEISPHRGGHEASANVAMS
ncbi:MAG: hypothetical protein ACLTYN_11695 [Dysosmobacter welbionis]